MSQVALTTQQRASRTRLMRRRIFNIIGIIIPLTVLAVLFLTPFAWLISTALKDLSELDAFPIQWLPSHPQWQNFVLAVTLIDYGHYAFNSLFLSTIYAILTTITCALVGFAFSRLRGVGQWPLFMIMLSTMMLPPILTTIPTYILFSRLQLVDTYWPWVLWGLSSSPFLSFLFRQFFANIPLELEEAAILDGCGYGRIFWQIFLPLSKPVIATVIIFAFMSVWGDYLAPSLLLSSDNTTLAVAMSGGYTDPHNNILTNVLAAGVIIYVAPVLVLFFFAQRYFVRGIVTTGLKG